MTAEKLYEWCALSIHLHSCQGGPLPSTLSSRLTRLAVGPERTRICCYAALTKRPRGRISVRKAA
jgi:hypothetical protein